MSAVLTSRVTQLLYVEAPPLNFAHVVGELHAALAAPDLDAPVLTWDCDDIALLDFSAGRVVVGFSDNLPGAHSACLTIAAGCSAIPDAPMLPQADQDLLCQALTERLDRRYPCDARLDQTLDQPLTPDLIDQLVDALGPDNKGFATLPVSGELVGAPLPLSSSEEVDVDRLMSRLSQELVTRSPSLISRAIASATSPAAPTLPVKRAKTMTDRHFWPMPLFAGLKTDHTSGTSTAPVRQRGASGELKAVRDALYAPDQAAISNTTRQLGVRIATHTRRALEALVSLPVGLANSAADLKRKQSIPERIRH